MATIPLNSDCWNSGNTCAVRSYLQEVLRLSEHVYDAYQAGGACQTPDAVVIWILPPGQLKAAVPVRAGLCWGDMNELALHGTASWTGACLHVTYAAGQAAQPEIECTTHMHWQYPQPMRLKPQMHLAETASAYSP